MTQQQENKTLITIIGITFSLIVIILAAAYVLNRTPKVETPQEQPEDLGYGFADETEPVYYDNEGNELDIYADPGFYVPDYEGADYTLSFGQATSDNVLKLANTSVEIPGVVSAEWSTDNSYLIFVKTELEGCKAAESMCIDDTGNLWVIKPDGTGLKKVFDYDKETSISYASNGKQIAFAVLDKVGVVNIDGSGLKYVYEFDEIGIPSGSIYTPGVTSIDDSTFTVSFTYEDWSQENKTFDL